MEYSKKTHIASLAQDAIDIQDASNLSGVVHAFSGAMTELRQIHRTEGTEFFNKHPIAVMYASKIASLTGSDDTLEFSKAYNAVQDIAGMR